MTGHIRRATRHDLPALHALMGAPAERRSERFERRLLRTLAACVYVAEDAGTVVGAVACSFAPSLALSRWCTILDGAWATADRPDVLDALVAFAEERGRRRASARVIAVGPVHPALRRVLAARGYERGDDWALVLAAAHGPSDAS